MKKFGTFGQTVDDIILHHLTCICIYIYIFISIYTHIYISIYTRIYHTIIHLIYIYIYTPYSNIPKGSGVFGRISIINRWDVQLHVAEP